MEEMIRWCYDEGSVQFSLIYLFWFVCSGEDVNRLLKCWKEALEKRNACCLSFLLVQIESGHEHSSSHFQSRLLVLEGATWLLFFSNYGNGFNLPAGFLEEW